MATSHVEGLCQGVGRVEKSSHGVDCLSESPRECGWVVDRCADELYDVERVG